MLELGTKVYPSENIPYTKDKDQGYVQGVPTMGVIKNRFPMSMFTYYVKWGNGVTNSYREGEVVRAATFKDYYEEVT
jgi:hypothetical protein